MASGMQENFLKNVKKSSGFTRQIVASALLAGFTTIASIALAQPNRAVTPNTEHATVGGGPTSERSHSASKAVLVLGDSLSAEYGLARGTGWVPLLEKRLKTEGLDAVITNASISGETTSGGKTRLPGLLEQYKPEIVVIELGGNDGLRGLPMGSTAGNLRDMVDLSKKSGARVLLLGMQIPPNYGADYTRQFAALYPKIAKETGATLVPFFLEGLQTRVDLFQSDRIHPTAAAQPLMLENVWPSLKSMLKDDGPVAPLPVKQKPAQAR